GAVASRLPRERVLRAQHLVEEDDDLAERGLGLRVSPPPRGHERQAVEALADLEVLGLDRAEERERLAVVRLGLLEAPLVQVKEREELQGLAHDAMVGPERPAAHLERPQEPLLGLLGLPAPVEQNREVAVALAEVGMLRAEALLEHGLGRAAVRLGLVEAVELLAADSPVAEVDRRQPVAVAEGGSVRLVAARLEPLRRRDVALPEQDLRVVAPHAGRREALRAVLRLDGLQRLGELLLRLVELPPVHRD